MATYNRKIQEIIMKDIKIKDPKKVYFQYMVDEKELINFIDNRFIDNRNKYVQNGCGNTIKLKYTYDNKRFILYEKTTEDGYDISIHRKDDIENSQTCLHIMINSVLKLAYIQNISYYKDCIKTGLDYPGGGSILLKMCIQFLKETKDRYKVSRLQLKDNSYFTCDDNKEKISLALLHTFVYGETWYGKYGFRPYKAYKNIRDETLYKIYKQNKNIVNNTKIKDTNLFIYIQRIIKKKVDNNENKERLLMKKFYDKFKDYTIKMFFKKYLVNFQYSCKAFSEFYVEFANDNNIYDFNGKSFYLDI